MRSFLIKFLLASILSIGLTVFLYWPIYQRLKLDDSISDINTEIKRLDLPIADELKEILDRSINVPVDRHQLCLKNNNRVYLTHTDNPIFRTPDISQTKDTRELNVGAIALEIYYSGDLQKDEVYRKIGEQKLCKPLSIKKLQHYASSSAFYNHIRLSQTDELDLGDFGKLSITRIIGNSSVDTSLSSASITAKWYLFWLTALTLVIFLFKPVSWIYGKLSLQLPIWRAKLSNLKTLIRFR